MVARSSGCFLLGWWRATGIEIGGALPWTSVESDDLGGAEGSQAFQEPHLLSPAGWLSKLTGGKRAGTFVTNIV